MLDLVKRFVEANQRKKELDDELDEIKMEIQNLEGLLIDQFNMHGVKNLNLDGAVVYVRRQLWASAPKDEITYEALKAHGLDFLVKEQIHSGTLSGWLREQVDLWEQTTGEQWEPGTPGPVETEILDNIRVSERVSIRVRKA